ncbi:hypothetical protein A2866_06595 [Candidatus Roizmanbacteria bacterium RIFCSPHIGHO2_01_FULL_39_8]|uniref:Peptidase C39 domain-containing protein n=3 Tax=Candidatus Roizmaniibacteriota TaxID=1752723 RepID=A0A1F7GI09_9BACT|nr:MAG: hypothetical protein A2866_06595 [Candidatus Roizmanbacteria bacterium RIFCSPHIGHO2_01_FULL_39_8]OGK27566.1 MAG: hypothetical protein A3C28_06060 [Candidatus Roizmanbacteria bacterium RIFCSPHIGHO2_02_FULL_39_9]OGK38160.1 MAG: hypothetical protein A3F60_03155 [Candidatus Roizmanbacteria bacterium RIFCSPHIGHO2_12_FULL_39_8]
MFKLILIILLIAAGVVFVVDRNQTTQLEIPLVVSPVPDSPTPSPTPILLAPPGSKILNNNYHVFQTFNNCGPAALSMLLSYYGISISQDILGNELRPYQNPQGDNDDKSVTVAELAEKSKDFNLIPYHRPNGNIDMVKNFLTYDMPVLTRTWTKLDEDIGHYRLIKGYDDQTQRIIQDDSLQGKNLWYSYQDFKSLWEKFNFEYLVLVPPDKKEIAEAILGEDSNEKIAWQKAVELSKQLLQSSPDDIYADFNLSVALYHIGDYQQSVSEFEKVEQRLPFRTLWYQIEPIQAYYELGNYDRVFSLTDKILNNWNRAFSELYHIRGQIYLKQGNEEAARQEFERALLYKYNFTPAQEALDRINS